MQVNPTNGRLWIAEDEYFRDTLHVGLARMAANLTSTSTVSPVIDNHWPDTLPALAE